jgi:hypothetical protein
VMKVLGLGDGGFMLLTVAYVDGIARDDRSGPQSVGLKPVRGDARHIAPD